LTKLKPGRRVVLCFGKEQNKDIVGAAATQSNTYVDSGDGIVCALV
jgi:hypothetical protein